MKHNFVHGYSKSQKIGSKLIRWGTKDNGETSQEVPSHYFIVFFRKIVIESKLESGVRVTYWGAFQQKNTIVKLLVPIGEQEKREKTGNMFKGLLEKSYGRPYDYMGVLYFAYRIILKKMFGWSMPEKNYWESPDKFFCDEIFSIVSGRDMSMKSPNDLMKEMVSRPDDFKCIEQSEVV